MTTLLSTRTLSHHFHHSRQFFYVLTDLKGICLYANPYFFQQNGINLLDGEGMNLFEFLQKEECDKLEKGINAAVANPSIPVSLDLHHGQPGNQLVHTIRWELQSLRNDEENIEMIQMTGMLLHRQKPSSTTPFMLLRK